LGKALSTAISSSGKNIKAKAPARPAQSENVGQHISSHPPRPVPSSRFPSRSADLASLVAVAEKRPPFLTRFFTAGLYIVLPLVLVFAVYVFIVFLRNSQPAPLAAESPEVPAVTKEFTEKSLPPQPVQAPPTTANPQETTETASPALQKPEAKRSSSNHVAAVTKPQPRIISPSEENSNKVVRVKDSSVEKAKKQALLLHLRQTYHLDLQDDQYTYEELKDINNRLERESRSHNNQ
jgi:hypothetical protein